MIDVCVVLIRAEDDDGWEVHGCYLGYDLAEREAAEAAEGRPWKIEQRPLVGFEGGRW